MTADVDGRVDFVECRPGLTDGLFALTVGGRKHYVSAEGATADGVPLPDARALGVWLLDHPLCKVSGDKDIDRYGLVVGARFTSGGG